MDQENRTRNILAQHTKLLGSFQERITDLEEEIEPLKIREDYHAALMRDYIQIRLNKLEEKSQREMPNQMEARLACVEGVWEKLHLLESRIEKISEWISDFSSSIPHTLRE